MNFESLHKFNVGPSDADKVVYAIPASRLLEPEEMERLLEVYRPLMKGLDRIAAATYFCNQFANVGLALQYAISVLGRSIDLSLSNITVQLYAQEGKSGIAYKLDRWSAQAAPIGLAERRSWLEDVYAGFYGGTVKPLYESVSNVSGIDRGQLWGLLPTRFNYMTEQWMLAAANEQERAAIADDYAFLAKELPASVFGRVKNPFDVIIRWVEDLKDPCKQLRMKNACCQYYRTEGGYYCYTCPRMKESEREERRLQARAAVAVSP